VERSAQEAQLIRALRSRSASHIVDLSDTDPDECAIYTLSDPRDIRVVRYVGQTRSPRRRFLQHLATARLWLPDELPWWVKRPDMRGLYQWIRELYLDEQRLPVMAVVAWTQASVALVQERALICEHLRRQSPLLNRESETFRQQSLLI
jgi:hypothetical protein